MGDTRSILNELTIALEAMNRNFDTEKNALWLFQRLEETVTEIAEFKNYFLDENGIIHETDMRKKE